MREKKGHRLNLCLSLSQQKKQKSHEFKFGARLCLRNACLTEILESLLRLARTEKVIQWTLKPCRGIWHEI